MHGQQNVKKVLLYLRICMPSENGRCNRGDIMKKKRDVNASADPAVPLFAYKSRI